MHTIFSFPSITTQRQAYRAERVRQAGGSPKCKCRISANQVARLEVIGFEWEMHDVFAARWEERFRSLLRFLEQHGHARVPQRYAKVCCVLSVLRGVRVRARKSLTPPYVTP